jgi:DNA-binding transcriptional MerR regulator
VPTTLSIGDFARATHLTIKTLRHYHRVGILEPVDVDPQTGYRRYDTGEIAVAQVIRRFRDLEMPLEDIRAVLSAPDVSTRNSVIASHLDRLEAELRRTRSATESLRDLLGGTSVGAPPEFEHVSVPAASAASITATIDVQDATPWYQGALGELRSTLAAQGVPPSGPPGGIYLDGLFSEGYGQATVFIPCDPTFRTLGRIETVVIPAVELATTIHTGPPTEIDRAYGALATHVAQHAVGVEGPIREYYLVDAQTDPDPASWRTQIGWPIFRTTAPRSRSQAC